MAKADPTTTQRLQRLDEHLRRIGLPIAGSLRPGLSDDEMDAITHPLGIDLPSQLRALWAWHDGADYPNLMITAQMQFSSLRRAVQDVKETREIDGEIDRVSAGFEPHWFLAFGALDGGGPAVDCREGAGAAVFAYSFSDGRTEQPQFESFNALLDWWLELFAADHFYSPDDERQVDVRDLDLPEHRLMLV